MVLCSRYHKEITVMNKKIYLSAISLLMVASSITNATDDINDLCNKSDVTIAYFNGVLTVEKTARKNLNEIEERYSDQSPSGENIKYQVMYNKSQFLSDFVETFYQRFSEETIGDRWELYTEIIKQQFQNNNGKTWLGHINDALTVIATVPRFAFDLIQREVVDSIVAALKLTAPIAERETYLKHERDLQQSLLEGNKVIMIAHSQGNLFVNKAYQYSISKTDSSAVGVIHVAPASIKLNGNHILADQDLVINGLRLSGSVPSNTHSIPVYKPFGNNFGRDAFGHGFLETYTNHNFPMYSALDSEVNNLFNTLKAPSKITETGFFNVMLTWDGLGDVDLHVVEPSGNKVMFSNPIGGSGYLDIDNTYANGPEHYFASCDATKLQTGAYRVGLANYSRADGRVATLQVKSQTGVSHNKSFVMGQSTGSATGINAFTLNVSKDEETGRYKVLVAE